MGGDTERRVVWDRAHVLALGPDTAARQAALSLPARAWSGLGRSGSRVWGRCQGSRSAPYEVVVDRDVPAYVCSCPSRKLPCKHALGLLLAWVEGRVPEADVPDVVDRRLSARVAAEEAQAPRAVGELADPAAAAARAAARAARVADGLDELDLWIGDQVRGGLAGLERAGHAAIEAVAARMVDAQAPGVAGMLRGIPGELALDGWPERVLEQLAALHLLIRAHRSLDRLPPALAATVRSRVGYPVSRNDVLALPGVQDDWWAVGQVDTVEYRLESRRVWLWGRHSRRWALWLTFAPAGGAADSTVVAGSRFTGSLHFYPGAGQHRAVIGAVQEADGPSDPPPADPSDLPPAETLGEARRRFADLVAEDPWASRMPTVLLVAPVPPATGDRWRVRDADGRCRDLIGLGSDPWPLLAASRGAPVPVMAEWSVAGVRPLAVLGRSGADSAVRRAA
ncbi:MAG: SWIM zinc finger family protein [Friedmanniella sp.]